MVPPGQVGEGAHIQFVGPGGAVLLGQVEICIRDFGGQHQAVMLHALALPQLLKFLRTEHLAQGIGGIDGAVNDDMGYVNPLGRELRIQGLAQHAPPAHAGGMGMLARIAAHGGGGGSDQYCALAPLLHTGADGGGGAEQGKGGHAPAYFERFVGCVRQGPVADLGAEIEDHDLYGANIRLNGGDPLFDVPGRRCQRSCGCFAIRALLAGVRARGFRSSWCLGPRGVSWALLGLWNRVGRCGCDPWSRMSQT